MSKDRFNFRIPMFTDKGSFMEFQYVEFGDFVECTLCCTNGEPQQCTGLKDKNGKLVYEGDVIKWGGTKFVIVWQFYKYALKKDINQKPIDYVLSCFDGTEFEIIGNIYENKDLLERTTNE